MKHIKLEFKYGKSKSPAANWLEITSEVIALVTCCCGALLAISDNLHALTSSINRAQLASGCHSNSVVRGANLMNELLK